MKRKGLILSIVALVLGISLLCVLAGCDSSGLIRKKVTLKLDYNGADGSYQTSFEGKAGKPLSLPTPTRSGYTFDGWYVGDSKVDASVFPDDDSTFTARYRSLESKNVVASFETPMNKVYGGDSGGYYYNLDSFGKSKSEVQWLLKNADVNVSIEWKMEAFLAAAQSAQFTGTAHGTLDITGASKSDVIFTFNVNNCDGYQTYSASKTIKAKIFISNSNDGRIINSYYDTGFSFAFDRSEVRFRNQSILLRFEIPAGSLV